jgi:hypothetical protein
VPADLDMAIVDQVVAGLSLGDIPAMGTAIGDGLGLGLAYLRKQRRQVEDRDPPVRRREQHLDPDDPAAGGRGRVRRSGQGLHRAGRRRGRARQFGNTVNPATLRNIATGHRRRFFKATDFSELQDGFETVRKELDKTRRVEKERKKDAELWVAPLAIALALLGPRACCWRDLAAEVPVTFAYPDLLAIAVLAPLVVLGAASVDEFRRPGGGAAARPRAAGAADAGVGVAVAALDQDRRSRARRSPRSASRRRARSAPGQRDGSQAGPRPGDRPRRLEVDAGGRRRASRLAQGPGLHRRAVAAAGPTIGSSRWCSPAPPRTSR